MTSPADAERGVDLEAIRSRYRESMNRFGYPVLSCQEVDWLLAELERLVDERNAWQMSCEEKNDLLGEARAEVERLRQREASLIELLTRSLAVLEEVKHHWWTEPSELILRDVRTALAQAEQAGAEVSGGN